MEPAARPCSPQVGSYTQADFSFRICRTLRHASETDAKRKYNCVDVTYTAEASQRYGNTPVVLPSYTEILSLMNLFECRMCAITELETHLRNEAEAIAKQFSLLDRCIAHLESRAGVSTLARSAGLATAKGKLLGQGCYSLILDGLAQESGALLRPLLEVA